MAVLALSPELALMRILRPVARDAGGLKLDVEHPALVATVAGGLFVRALERELRFFGVIEANGLPLLYGMASVTLGAEATAMNVLDLVAIDTAMRQAFVALAHMAGGAGHFAVSPFERECGLGVVECLRLSPVVLPVA